jgi:hypothetical protein
MDGRKLSASAVAAMPPAQVLLLYIVDIYHQYRDDTFKAGYLPFSEGRRAFKEAEARRLAAPNTEAKQLPDALLPAIVKVQLAQMRLERRIAALRVIEALRMHVAAHDGHLPEALSEITLAPVPDDPGTGKPFAYQWDGEIATLTGGNIGEKDEVTSFRYRLVMRKQ